MIMRATISWVYNADPKHYGTEDPAAMAAIDSDQDPLEMLDLALSRGTDVELTVEPHS